MRSITTAVRGVSTRYFDEDGQPLVPIHGGGPGASLWWADVWERSIPELAGHFRVIPPDRLEQWCKGNPLTLTDYRVAAIARHLIDLLGAPHVTGATIVGQSSGAFIAAYLAMTAPPLVSRLVLVNSATLAPATGPEELAPPSALRGGPEDIRHDAEWYAVDGSYVTDSWVQRTSEMLRSPVRAAGREDMRRASASYLADFAFEKRRMVSWRRRSTDGPDRGCVGASGTQGDAAARRGHLPDLLAGRSPGAVPRAEPVGHCPFSEHPAEFNELVADFATREFAALAV